MGTVSCGAGPSVEELSAQRSGTWQAHTSSNKDEDTDTHPLSVAMGHKTAPS